MNVGILGAGVTGLTAAFRLKRAGVPFTLYEASSRAGGVIATHRMNGFLAESGPNTLLETSPVIAGLIQDLGLESSRMYSNPQALNRYVVRDGKLIPVPDTPLRFFTSSLFSWSAKCRLLREPWISRAPAHLDESVEQFVLRRLGREFLDYAINPMIGGIYAGDPARLSVLHAFPKLHEVEQRYGSLILGQTLGARERARRKEVSKQTAPKFSFPGGLQTLTDTLFEKVSDQVRLRSPIQRIRRLEDRWNVHFTSEGSERVAQHDALLLAGTAHQLAGIELATPHSDQRLTPLSTVTYAPVAAIVLGFRRDEVSHPLDGFGVLVPAAEKANILGVLFSSTLFPGRAPEGFVTLSCYVGGLRSPELAELETQELLRRILPDLGRLLGVRGSPVFVHHVVHRKAIPQYEVGFGRIRDHLSKLERELPGLFFAGHYRDGISLSDSLLSGDHAAGRLQEYLAGLSITERMRGHVPELHQNPSGARAHEDDHDHDHDHAHDHSPDASSSSHEKSHGSGHSSQCTCACGGKGGTGDCARKRLKEQAQKTSVAP